MRIEASKIIKVFISHSFSDKDIVTSFSNTILQLGLGISEKDIYCSSMPGLGSSAGSDFIKDIKIKLKEADIVFLLLSEKYYKSITCLQEMGAAWILNKEIIIPLTFDTIDKTKTGHLLNTIIQVDLQKSESLDLLNDTIKNKFGLSGTTTSLWNGYVGEFIKSISNMAIQNPKKSVKDESIKIKLSSHEKSILESISSDVGESSPIIRIVIKTRLKESVVKTVVSDLLKKGLLEAKGSDYKLTEKATRLIHNI